MLILILIKKWLTQLIIYLEKVEIVINFYYKVYQIHYQVIL